MQRKSRKKKGTESTANRLQIYFPADLKKRMGRLQKIWAVSWSSIACDAFEKECARLEALEKKLR